MTPKDFCEWLQAFLDNVHPDSIDTDQLAVIKDHLQLVFHTDNTP